MSVFSCRAAFLSNLRLLQCVKVAVIFLFNVYLVMRLDIVPSVL